MDMKSTCPCPNLIGSLMGDPDTRYSSTEAAKTPFFSLWFPDEWGRAGNAFFALNRIPQPRRSDGLPPFHKMG
jgi:hypothetical protein